MNGAEKTSEWTVTEPHYVCFLGLGANLGDRLASLRAAVGLLDADERIAVDFPRGIASLYESAPVGCDAEQPSYLNGVIRAETTLSPGDLLAASLDIERKLGRARTARWAARVIDIDVLLFGEITIEQTAGRLPALRTGGNEASPFEGGGGNAAPISCRWVVAEADALTLPHPRICERRFVLEPLADIAANVVHPIANRTIAELTERAAKDYAHQTITRIAGPEWVKTASNTPEVSSTAS